jgi:hypothetical protein
MSSVYAGLVTVDEQSGIIRLVHYTTEEYFKDIWQHWFPNAQMDLSKTSVTCLSSKVYESQPASVLIRLEERLRLNPVYEYAACYWGFHASKVDGTSGNNTILSFLRSKYLVRAASQAFVPLEELQSLLESNLERGIYRSSFSSLPWHSKIC